MNFDIRISSYFAHEAKRLAKQVADNFNPAALKEALKELGLL